MGPSVPEEWGLFFLRHKNSGTPVSKMLGPACLHEVWDHLCPNVRGLCLPLRMSLLSVSKSLGI